MYLVMDVQESSSAADFTALNISKVSGIVALELLTPSMVFQVVVAPKYSQL